MKEQLNVSIVFDQAGNQSLAVFNNETIGECQFEIKDNKWYIVHTGVRPEFGGRGIARLLVEKIIEEANNRGTTIVPICSYAKKVMEK